MNAEMKLRIINEILAGFFGGIDYDKSAVGTLCAISSVTEMGEDELVSDPDKDFVFCADCEYYKADGPLAPNRFCFRLKDGEGHPVGYNFAPGDFCSYGKRRGT